jgi:predicted Fe-Mo cluster-binding NifX family protein
MKIAISSVGKNLDGNIADVFGRCPYFIIVDIEKGEIKGTEVIKNANGGQQSGAGMAAAKLIAEKGASVVIAKNVGPRASAVLKQFNIEVYSGEGVINDVLQNFIDKKLKK